LTEQPARVPDSQPGSDEGTQGDAGHDEDAVPVNVKVEEFNVKGNAIWRRLGR
jgi:hypothetical protein